MRGIGEHREMSLAAVAKRPQPHRRAICIGILLSRTVGHLGTSLAGTIMPPKVITEKTSTPRDTP